MRRIRCSLVRTRHLSATYNRILTPSIDQAQAGAQGMEDAAALGIVLQGVSTPEEIEERLDLYQKIRYTRASVVQVLSNVGADECHLVHDDLKEFLEEKDIPCKHNTLHHPPPPLSW